MSDSNGFIDLRIGQGAQGMGDDSVWPSFTDVMTVIVMIFLMALVVIMLRNFELDHELDVSKTEQAAVSNRNEVLIQQLSSLQQKLLSIEQSLGQSEEQNRSLQLNLDQEQRRYQALSVKQNSAEQQLADLLREWKELTELKESLLEQTEEIRNRFADENQGPLTINQAIALLVGNNDRLEKEKQALLQELQAVSRDNTELNDQLEVANQTATELSDRKAVLAREVQIAMLEIVDLQEREKTLVDKISALDRDLAERLKQSAAQVAQLNSQNQVLRDQNLELNDQNTELNTKNMELNVENTELNTKNTELNVENTELNTKNTELNTKNAELNAENTELNTKNAELNAENTELNTRNTELNAENTELSDLYSQLNTQNLTLSNRNVELNNLNSELNIQNLELDSRNTELLNRNSELGNKNASLNTENSSLSSENLTLSDKNTELQKLIEAFTAQVESTEAMLARVEAEKRELNEKLAGLNDQLARVDELRAKNKAQFDEANQQVLTLSEQLESEEKERLSLIELSGLSEARLEALQEEYRLLEEKYTNLVRPARSKLGKYVVEVVLRKTNDVESFQYRLPQGELVTFDRQEDLLAVLDGLKEEYGDQLYTQVIIPDSSDVSHAQAWRFTQMILNNYDYYSQ